MEKGGRAFEVGGKTYMQSHVGIKGHGKVEETVQNQQEMSQQT